MTTEQIEAIRKTSLVLTVGMVANDQSVEDADAEDSQKAIAIENA